MAQLITANSLLIFRHIALILSMVINIIRVPECGTLLILNLIGAIMFPNGEP